MMRAILCRPGEDTIQDRFPIIKDAKNTYFLSLWVSVSGVSTYVGTGALERVDLVTYSAHIYVLPEYRTGEVLKQISEQWLECRAIKQLIHDIRIKKLVTSCSYDNEGVHRLMEGMGFNPKAHWIGFLDVEKYYV